MFGSAEELKMRMKEIRVELKQFTVHHNDVILQHVQFAIVCIFHYFVVSTGHFEPHFHCDL